MGMNPSDPLNDLRWQIQYLTNPHSFRYGQLLKWHYRGEWHLGIGLSDSHILDIGERFQPILQEDALCLGRNITSHITLLQSITRRLQALGLHFWDQPVEWDWNHTDRAVAIATDTPDQTALALS